MSGTDPTLRGEAGYGALVWRVIEEAVTWTTAVDQGPAIAPEAEFRDRAVQWLSHSGPALAAEEREVVIADAVADIYHFGPLTELLNEAGVTDVLVNGPDQVMVDRGGGVEPTNVRFRDAAHLESFILRHVSRAGRAINYVTPVVDVDLPDGSRMHAAIPPVAGQGPTVSIRRFRPNMSLEVIQRVGAMAGQDVAFLRDAILKRKNIVIAGGPGAGKTTLLTALLDEVDPRQRVVGIEEVPEIRPQRIPYVRLLTRQSSGPGVVERTARDLVREALRMRPDRLVVGEVRGPEALDMVSAMSTGMNGSLTTLHASSTSAAMDRLAVLLELASGTPAASKLARQAIDLVIFLERDAAGRRRIAGIERLQEGW